MASRYAVPPTPIVRRYCPHIQRSLIEYQHFADLFGRLILDGQWTDTWEYIRFVTTYIGFITEMANNSQVKSSRQRPALVIRHWFLPTPTPNPWTCDAVVERPLRGLPSRLRLSRLEIQSDLLLARPCSPYYLIPMQCLEGIFNLMVSIRMTSSRGCIIPDSHRRGFPSLRPMT